MTDLVNWIVFGAAMFAAGLATHSFYLHEKKRRGWRFPWDHDE